MNQWPILKTIQSLSPELYDPTCVYRAGDLLLPYWTIRPPAELHVAIVAIGTSWTEWRSREDGGGFVARYKTFQSPNDPKNDIVERVEVYCVSARGRFMTYYIPFMMDKLLNNMIGAVRSWSMRSIMSEHKGNYFWMPVFIEMGTDLGSLSDAVHRALSDMGVNSPEPVVQTEYISNILEKPDTP